MVASGRGGRHRLACQNPLTGASDRRSGGRETAPVRCALKPLVSQAPAELASVLVVASGLSCPKSQQVSPVDEGRYHSLMAPQRDKWRARASDPSKREQARVYAQRRANALDRPVADKVARCSTTGCEVKCSCPGRREVRPYTCRCHLVCRTCLVQRSRRLGARMRAGLEAAVAGAPAGHRLVLLTLTIRHSGDVALDRQRLATGWRRLYKMLHRRGWGKFAYVGVWEVTRGSDGLGHVHAHVACLWPWRDWSVVRALWLAACPDSQRITFVGARRDGKPSTPKSVANYLGKYLSKGVQTEEFTPQLRADVLAATYNTRWVFSSRKFWQPFVPLCKCCQCPWVRVTFHYDACYGPWPDPYAIAAGERDGPGCYHQASLPLPDPNERDCSGSARRAAPVFDCN